MTDIAVALIAAGSSLLVGLMSLIGVIITSSKNNNKIRNQIEISQAVTRSELNELTREVREHNNFARRVPVLEEQIKVANHRIADLEEFHKGG